jgi:hypothetical protein
MAPRWSPVLAGCHAVGGAPGHQAATGWLYPVPADG